MKLNQPLVLIVLSLLFGCELKSNANLVDREFKNEVMLVQVEADQNQNLIVELLNQTKSDSFQITYQQLDADGNIQVSDKLEIGEIVSSASIYRGVYPVSFGSVLFGFVLLTSENDADEMQGFLFVWNGRSWRFDEKTRVLLNNLTDANEIESRLEKVFPHNGLNSSIKLMSVKDLHSAKEKLGEVFFPELQVDSKQGGEFSILAKLDTGSESIFLLEQSAGEMDIYRLPSPFDSVIPQTCRPVEASVKQCGVNAITSLSIVYNCESPDHNQSENEVNVFEIKNESWVLQSQTSCDPKSKPDKSQENVE